MVDRFFRSHFTNPYHPTPEERAELREHARQLNQPGVTGELTDVPDYPWMPLANWLGSFGGTGVFADRPQRQIRKKYLGGIGVNQGKMVRKPPNGVEVPVGSVSDRSVTPKGGPFTRFRERMKGGPHISQLLPETLYNLLAGIPNPQWQGPPMPPELGPDYGGGPQPQMPPTMPSQPSALGDYIGGTSQGRPYQGPMLGWMKGQGPRLGAGDRFRLYLRGR